MRTLTLVILLLPLIAASAATTQPAKWVLEARVVEAGPTGPTTQPTTPAAALLVPSAKVLSSIEVSAVDREPFSATTMIGDRQIRLSGRARASKGPTPRVLVEFQFADQTVVAT